jgi:hydrogenase maturation protease
VFAFTQAQSSPEAGALENGKMSRTLVIGYGNRDRQDDGVAWEVIDVLRHRAAQPSLAEDETGLEQLGNQVDSVFMLQLAPDLLDIAADYDQLIFVDAHLQPDAADLYCTPVQPEYATATFTHHMTPAMFLALLQALHHRQPAGFVVSIRGNRFDFERGLSAATQALVEPAVAQIQQLLTAAEES